MKAFALADEGASAAVIEVPTPEPGPDELRITDSVDGTDMVIKLTGDPRRVALSGPNWV